MALVASAASAQSFKTTFAGDTAIVTVNNPTKYLILPIEENRPEAQVLLDNGKKTDTWMDVRLAISKTDYSVPFALSQGKKAVVKIVGLPKDAVALKQLKLSDTFDTTNTDYYRPVYHHTPLYGWMNDANGLTYKDGEYHLYFQYNPYGSKWGNMHWGHSVSRDLVHWEHLDPAIARDPMGHIFSGSTVVDTRNSAGFGKNAIIAYYTSHSMHDGKQVQVQCMAYSKDNGRTFTKYKGNPVVTPFDGLENFRDPKIFWYQPTKSWYMIVSADKNMRFYQSKNLKQWKYVSQWGEGFGAQPNQFECPDFFPLPVDGDKNNQKYVMIVNINPGFVYGGSATEYFVGEFDGKEFKCDSKPQTVKWLDWGKDHYATVTFSNLGGRIVAVPWMSNWQYANYTPIRQYRGANGLPRELSLYTKDGQTYMAANVVPEARQLRKEGRTLNTIALKGEDYKLDKMLPTNDGAYEMVMDIVPGSAQVVGLELYNAKGEKSLIYLDMKSMKLVMDRSESGLTAFGEKSEPHAIENHDRRKTNSINYKNDFALGTWAPLNLCEGKRYHLDIFVDKCSVEIFVDGGRIAMTNLIFPTEPYNSVRFYAEGGEASVENVEIFRLGL